MLFVPVAEQVGARHQRQLPEFGRLSSQRSPWQMFGLELNRSRGIGALRLPDDALLRNPSAGSPSGTNRKTHIDMHQQQNHIGTSRQTVDARFLR